MLRDLAALRWLGAGESVILYGPVGVGKAYVGQAFSHAVARRVGDVRFAKTFRGADNFAEACRLTRLQQQLRDRPPHRPPNQQATRVLIKNSGALSVTGKCRGVR
ncbi:hypothetical protein MSIMFI_05439 [Mycobacterium simulans]|nr:hypothetical protein MSIMFI_05439 [Mycobacterium simulans]